ncbi:hypothetical protein LWE61_18915 [Sphingobium sufflavum]|uniref:hypothetical protein n=1 Tax=Sphingobium sufflavum TaxID=1129547 RepID=UPI001F2ED2C2|nr:hypothetical protein [Sphingobium sufflavum]MCE7798606.1 hypothetical protein [Sphingobium sufflavum]
MTDSDPGLSPLPDAQSQARAARQRFFAISLFRISGALILVFGVAIAQQHFGWVRGEKARIMGMIVVAVGFIQMMVIPRMLLRAFRTPSASLPPAPTSDQP